MVVKWKQGWWLSYFSMRCRIFCLFAVLKCGFCYFYIFHRNHKLYLNCANILRELDSLNAHKNMSKCNLRWLSLYFVSFANQCDRGSWNERKLVASKKRTKRQPIHPDSSVFIIHSVTQQPHHFSFDVALIRRETRPSSMASMWLRTILKIVNRVRLAIDNDDAVFWRENGKKKWSTRTQTPSEIDATSNEIDGNNNNSNIKCC